jgi:hypothetical protein
VTARLMADSTTPADMPDWVSVKGFYADGQYAASQAQIQAWRGPRALINVTGDPAHGGNTLDVETGDATPADVPAWYDGRLAAGVRWPAVYCDRNKFDAVTAALGSRNAARWLATLDGTLLHTFHGQPLVACQHLGADKSGGNFDLSVVFAGHWLPSWDAEIPSADVAHLARLANITQNDLGRLVAAIRQL